MVYSSKTWGELRRGGSRGRGPGGQDPPFWGTPKLHKEKERCVNAQRFSTFLDPSLSEILDPHLTEEGGRVTERTELVVYNLGREETDWDSTNPSVTARKYLKTSGCNEYIYIFIYADTHTNRPLCH